MSKLRRSAVSLAGLAVLLIVSGSAASQADRSVHTACTTEAHRAFDFWVGTWDVVGVTGAIAGRNVITRINGDCTLHESYVGGSGYVGQSLNAYDAPRDRWHQTWSDVTGLLLRLEGGSPRPGVMQLLGARQDGEGRTLTDRITWTAHPDGTVRQHWESSTDAGMTWTTIFDGRYVRVESPR